MILTTEKERDYEMRQLSTRAVAIATRKLTVKDDWQHLSWDGDTMIPLRITRCGKNVHKDFSSYHVPSFVRDPLL